MIEAQSLEELYKDEVNLGPAVLAAVAGHVTAREAQDAIEAWRNKFVAKWGEQAQLDAQAFESQKTALQEAHAAELLQLGETHGNEIAKATEAIRIREEQTRVALAELQKAETRITELEAEVIALTPPPVPALVEVLDDAFSALLSPEEQAGFASAYAVVRVLVESGKVELAKSFISGTQVPPELEEAKADLLALFD